MVQYIYKILIIDDDAGVRDVLKKFLEEKGYETETVGDSREVIDRIKARSFDIILVDLMMPVIGGIDILRGIKQFDSEAVVIIMTGYASLETAIQAIREGAYDYITKPFRLEEIYITIKNACEKIFLKRQHKAFIDELRKVYESSPNTKKMSDDKSADETNNNELARLTSLLDRRLLTKNEFDVLRKLHIKD
ncbi:MAG: sigma-54-dependent Fis family transcriptional regulator [Deltaproteobacteria bacterium]|nr:sigma-54-dependent Fis family transcriptional regulator [Deltaproteobacteria bacterium]